jgi:hypothetical protein
METLRAELNRLLDRLPDKDALLARLDGLTSMYPFNEYEFLIAHLLAADAISIDDYYLLRDEYIARNLFLYLFEISAPRGFGETWAQGHLKELVPELVKPTKKIEPNYAGQYDFLLDDRIRIEVKASRAVAFQTDEPLYLKALSSDSEKAFDMNFQQIKPACCDVFIWIGVWRDRIRYWVLASNDVAQNRCYSAGQHRGNIGEGQLHLMRDNIAEFATFEARSNTLASAIREAFNRQSTHVK